MRIFKTEIPKGSSTQQYLPVDYTDAFACKIGADIDLSTSDIQLNQWTHKPRWVSALFKLRNIIVRPFGLDTGNIEDINERTKEMISSGEGSVGSMSVAAKSENETVLFLNDKHLEAYTSIHIEKEEDSQIVTTITLVRFHNLFGKIYFFFIKPFHKIVAKSGLKTCLKRSISVKK